MPASTPFLGLYKPGGGSTGLITPDEVVDIDRLNTNSDLIDAFAKSYGPATERNHQLYGPAASLGSVSGMKPGDTYQESDGNKVLWKYDGTNWVTGESGMYLIRPSSVVNATINADGSVSPNAAVANFSLNNVFSTRFRRYQIDYYLRQATASALQARLRVAGVDKSTTDYNWASLELSGASVSGLTVGAQNNYPVNNPGTFSNLSGSIELTNPAHTAPVNQPKTFYSHAESFVTNVSIAIRNGYLVNWDATSFDGITFIGLSSTTDPALSWFKVYGRA